MSRVLEEIKLGLARPQKELPSKLFYDERGSQLFEQITRLPEYYLTRVEHALLSDVQTWVAEQRFGTLVELGPGSAGKTRIILDTLCARGERVTYVPFDISAVFLEQTAAALRAEYANLDVVPVAADFTSRITLPAALSHPLLLTFLGSTIGNFAFPDAVALLRRVRTAMRPDDRFMLGVDLRKDSTVLEAAYNDSRGITAEFNRNVLRVVNREFGADFDIAAFRHRAFYNEAEHRIEMHLMSTRAQAVHLPGAGTFELEDGETIRTEISCKYDRQTVAEMCAAAELELTRWHEDGDGQFALAVAVVQEV